MHLLDDLSDAVPAAGRPGHDPAADLAALSFALCPDWRGGDGGTRVLVFTAPHLEVELEVMADRVVGQIIPPGPGQVLVETAGGITFQVDADDIGFFDLSVIMPRGSVRLRCDTPTGHLVTDWICL